MAWIENVLAENTDARWTFVIVHQLLWNSPQIYPDWLWVKELLGGRGYTVFTGHTHRHTRHIRHIRRGRQFITLATPGGGSEMRGLPWSAASSWRFTLRTQGAGGEPVEIERELAMVADGNFGVAPLDHMVTVDGKGVGSLDL